MQAAVKEALAKRSQVVASVSAVVRETIPTAVCAIFDHGDELGIMVKLDNGKRHAYRRKMVDGWSDAELHKAAVEARQKFDELGGINAG